MPCTRGAYQPSCPHPHVLLTHPMPCSHSLGHSIIRSRTGTPVEINLLTHTYTCKNTHITSEHALCLIESIARFSVRVMKKNLGQFQPISATWRTGFVLSPTCKVVLSWSQCKYTSKMSIILQWTHTTIFVRAGTNSSAKAPWVITKRSWLIWDRCNVLSRTRPLETKHALDLANTSPPSGSTTYPLSTTSIVILLSRWPQLFKANHVVAFDKMVREWFEDTIPEWSQELT